MNIIYAIHKKYSNLIFSGEKNLEFRMKIGVNVHKGDTVFFYETKRAAGLGKVSGSATIGDIIPISYHKVGTYFMLPYYVEKYGTEEEKAAVVKALNINLSNYDKSIVLSYLFDDHLLDYMKENDDLPDFFKYPPFHGYTVAEFNERHKKAKDLCTRCDEWAKKIGFYNEEDTSYWKYAIILKKIHQFSKPRPIESFRNKKGDRIKKAPQSWCYTIEQD